MIRPCRRRARALPVIAVVFAVGCSGGGSSADAPPTTGAPASTSLAVLPASSTAPASELTAEASGSEPAAVMLPVGEPHPLGGLTAVELARVRQVLTDAGMVASTTRFPYVGLHPPDKAAVLAWRPGQPFSRRADVVLHDLATGAVATAVVDVGVGQQAVVSSESAPSMIPGYVADEFGSAVAAAQADPRIQVGLASRGVNDGDAYCLAFSPGAARAPEEQGRRLLRVSCYRAADDGSVGWSQPIDGLVATVALDDGPTVLSVLDEPSPAAPSATVAEPAARAPLAPIGVAAVSNAVVTDSSAEWAGWKLRWRMDRRVGIVLADVSIDAGWGRVPVLYEASISDMYVPYQDPDPAWSWRTFLDAGEFGLGASLSELAPGVDCPETAAFAQAAVPNDRGDAITVARAVCLYERAAGAPAWRHSSGTGAAAEGVPATELVVRSAMTVGNYDYLLDVVFGRDGSLRFEVAASGIVLQRTSAAATAAEFAESGEGAHGTLVAPGLVGVHHDHFVNFRLDLDVGGPTNRFVNRHLTSQPVADDGGRSAIWATGDEVVGVEGSVPMPASPGADIWRIEAATPGPAPMAPAWVIAPGDALAGPIVEASETSLATRAAWAAQPLWVTAYDQAQRFAGGDSLPGGGAGGLPAWVAAARPIDGADVVAWFTVGFHHIVRAEDLPVMPVHHATFSLIPENVFPANPVS